MPPLAAALLALAFPHSSAELGSRAQALSPDGKLFAFSVSDGTVRVASLPEGKAVRALAGLPTVIDDLTFSLDGSAIAGVADDGTLFTLGASGNSPARRIEASIRAFGPQWRSRSIRFVDAGRRLFIAGGSERARLIEWPAMKSVREWTLADEGRREDPAPITADCASEDGMHLAIGDKEGRYAVFRASTGELEFGPWRGAAWTHALAFDRDGKRLAVGAGDCRVRVLGIDPPAAEIELSHCDQDLFGDLSIGCVRFGPDGRSLLASSFSFWEVRLWDLETRTPRWAFDHSGGAPGALPFEFSADGELVISAHMGSVLDAATGRQLRSLASPSKHECFRTSGTRTWSVASGMIRILDARDGKLVCEIPLAAAPAAPAPR